MVLLPQFLAGPVEDLAAELQMVELNMEREGGTRGWSERRGIPPLERKSELTAVARAYRRRMATTGNVNHNLDRPVEERIKDALPNSCMFGENVSIRTSSTPSAT